MKTNLHTGQYLFRILSMLIVWLRGQHTCQEHKNSNNNNIIFRVSRTDWFEKVQNGGSKQPLEHLIFVIHNVFIGMYIF